MGIRRLRRYITLLGLLASSRYSKDFGWQISCATARISIENIIDFLTVYDLWVDRHYDRLESAATTGSVVWDIGANVGATSLIFAQNPNVSHIYAYEPMPKTLIYARRSLRANPDLSSKITLVDKGIGGCDGTVEMNYTHKAKCAIGIAEIPSKVKTIGRVKDSDMELINIPLADACRALRVIRERHPWAQILLKLDAEGAEYQIIDRLVKSGAIGEISAAAIEWHFSPGPGYLLERLHEAGFATALKYLEEDGSIGMIDAWRVPSADSRRSEDGRVREDD